MLRIRYETFALTEPEAVAAHLTKLAARGWLLCAVQNPFWVYRKGAPQSLTYALACFPDAAAFGRGRTAEQQQFVDACGEAGWRYAAHWAQLQIFCTDRPDPVPLETDGTDMLETLRRSMRQNALPARSIVLLLLLALTIPVFWWHLRSLTEFLSSGTALSFCALLAVAVVYNAYLLISDALWYRRAGRAAASGADGSRLTARGRRWTVRVLELSMAFWLVLYLGVSAYTGDTSGFLSLLYGIAFMSSLAFVSFLSRKKVSDKICSWIRAGLTLLLVLLVTHSIGFPKFAPSISPQSLPLTLQDLRYEASGDSWASREASSSILLDRTECSQHVRLFDDTNVSLHYVVCTSRYPWVLDLCRRQYVSSIPLTPLPGALAGVDAAYVGAHPEHGAGYLLCRGSRLVWLQVFAGTPTAEQLEIAAQALLGAP